MSRAIAAFKRKTCRGTKYPGLCDRGHQIQIGTKDLRSRRNMLDMHADFDVVLGMEWILEWDPRPEWQKLEFTVETSTGTKRIRRLPIMPNIQVLPVLTYEIKAEFNLISHKELRKALKGVCTLLCSRRGGIATAKQYRSWSGG